LFTVMQILETMAMVALSAFMGASIMGFVVSFFSSIMVFATVGIVLEVIICILSGVYVPVGVFPDFIQKMISVSPFGNLAALFRQVLIEGSITKVFKGVPEESIDQYRLFYGIDIVMKDIRMDRLLSVKFILGFSSGCLLLFFINYSIKSKKI
jgi:multidrug/hemolysin transport system permease protein